MSKANEDRQSDLTPLHPSEPDLRARKISRPILRLPIKHQAPNTPGRDVERRNPEHSKADSFVNFNEVLL